MKLCRSELAREEPENAAFIQHERGGLEFFASKLAPTKGGQKWYLTRKLAVS